MESAVPARSIVTLMRPLRWIAAAGIALAVGIALWLAYWEYRNSMHVPAASAAELHDRLTRAKAWVFTNKDRLLGEPNIMLWLFIRDAARVTHDPKLLALAEEFQRRYTNGTPLQYFFDSNGSERVTGQRIEFGESLQDYQRLLFYGATCNAPARWDPEVATLLTPGACDHNLLWLRSPWCRTHQLMGLRFVQKNHCDPDSETDATVVAVQDSILSELRWDFRVGDAYLQMVWTLVESGRRKDVKPIWIRRILDAQQADGAWDGVQVLARLPGGRVLAWDGHPYPRIISEPAPTFHATAQGLYLLALLESGS